MTSKISGQLPRGIRNNNPGNIRKNTANNWKGVVRPGTDKEFEQFIDMPHGVRALRVLIENYIKNGNNTIQKIIGRYAPSHENPTAEYANFVASRVGVLKDMPIYQFNIPSIVKAIIEFENGANYIDNDDLDAGMRLV